MKLAVYVKKHALRQDPRFSALRKQLSEGGCTLYDIETASDLEDGTGMLLSVGGDGTFLSASKRVGDREIPVLGVNLGRLGFLSEHRPEDVAAPLLAGDYTIEDRTLLKVGGAGLERSAGFYPFALNEVSIHRVGAAMVGVSVTVDGAPLPTYWADGLLVATSSGSTAYSLSAGGPICTPDARVLIITPIAPHNLNVRPLVVPDSARIGISVTSRDPRVIFSMDNRDAVLPAGLTVSVSVAQFSLKRVGLGRSNFVNALTSKLFWGEDVRNGE